MDITHFERQEFVYFMQQHYWEKHFQKDVTIYSIETDWLKPYHPVFYIGATQNLRKRERQHRRVWRKHLTGATPTEFSLELAAIEDLMEQAYFRSTAIRKGIIAAAHYQEYMLTFTQLATLSLQDYPQNEQTTSIFEAKAIQLGLVKTRFSIEVLEKERRWIFKRLQEHNTLTNLERLYTEMIGELCARPTFDVLTTPFSSSAWNPIIQGYFRDKERLGILLNIL
jgi:hypothetical protein